MSKIIQKGSESCPGCGAAQFVEVGNIDNVVISTPPEGGYKINLSWGIGDKVMIVLCVLFYVIGLYLIIEAVFLGFVNMFFLEVEFLSILLFAVLTQLLPGIGLFFVGRFFTKRILSYRKRKKHLRYNGILVKNMPYSLVETGIVINDIPIYAIKVIYTDANGIEIPLVSKREYKGHSVDDDGGVDLLIDPNDYTNYYIDFEIY